MRSRHIIPASVLGVAVGIGLGMTGLPGLLGVAAFLPAVLIVVASLAFVSGWYLVTQRAGWAWSAFTFSCMLTQAPFALGLLPTFLGNVASPAFGVWAAGIATLAASVLATAQVRFRSRQEVRG